MVARRNERNLLFGVSLLLTFLFAPFVPKRKVVKRIKYYFRRLTNQQNPSFRDKRFFADDHMASLQVFFENIVVAPTGIDEDFSFRQKPNVRPRSLQAKMGGYLPPIQKL